MIQPDTQTLSLAIEEILEDRGGYTLSKARSFRERYDRG